MKVVDTAKMEKIVSYKPQQFAAIELFKEHLVIEGAKE